ncbi:MAG: hypothetical protein HY731_05520 [Candidatus Tectomicrobia bacterium]|nr:hypothetical protein [Candidatus Tectomicrobia bacterium]
MSFVDEAIQKDVEGKVVEAANLYEEILKAGDAPLEVYLNLAVLYWEMTDYGVNAGLGLSLEFIQRAGKRYREVLRKAQEQFSMNPEILFWLLYCDFITLGEAPFVKQCEQLVKEPHCSLVPYFYLYMAYNGRKYHQEAMKLLDHCQRRPTTKNCYISSVIQSTIHRYANK